MQVDVAKTCNVDIQLDYNHKNVKKQEEKIDK